MKFKINTKIGDNLYYIESIKIGPFILYRHIFHIKDIVCKRWFSFKYKNYNKSINKLIHKFGYSTI